MRCWSCALLLVALAAAAPAHARDLYVNNERGDDRANGLAPDNLDRRSGPVKTISAALRKALKGDRIIVAKTDTVYRECITMSGGENSGTPVQPFVIEGNGAIVDGSTPIYAKFWQQWKGEVYRYRPLKLNFTNLFLDDRPAERVAADDTQPEPPALQPLQWCRHRGLIYFAIEPKKTIEDYHLSRSGHDVGLTLYQVRHVIVADLVFQGFRLDGINAHETRDCLLVGVRCRGNGRSGIAAAGTARLDVVASVVGDNGQGQESTRSAQLWVDERAVARLENCDVIPNTAPEMHKGGLAQVIVKKTAEPAADAPPQQP